MNINQPRTSKIKKRYYLTSLLAIVAISSTLFLSGCKKEHNKDLLDLDLANITQMTESQRVVFDEAVKRIDPFVSFTEGQFVMSIDNGEEVGVSERLFEYFLQNFNITNHNLQQAILSGQSIVETKRNQLLIIPANESFDFTLAKTKVLEEGGFSGAQQNWWGTSFYMSQQDVTNIGHWLTGAAVASAWIPEPFWSKVAATITGGGAIACSVVADKNPNGIVLQIPNIGAPMYVPQSALNH